MTSDFPPQRSVSPPLVVPQRSDQPCGLGQSSRQCQQPRHARGVLGITRESRFDEWTTSDLSRTRGRAASLFALVAWSLAWLSLTTPASAEPIPDYTTQIRPLLSNACFSCHGFDPAGRKGELRLDRREDAVADRGGGPAIVPQDPDASELIRRIESSDPAEQMPPPASGRELSAADRQLLRRWVAAGAPYQRHWAFLPPQRSIPPVEPHPEPWGASPLDAFIGRELRQRGLAPSPEAPRVTQIRRLYLDLLGVTPSPEQVARFLADDSPAAYPQLVDRLMANPLFGERWGRHWLDQARYADSHGYTIDGPRVMWPYRDWVIAALNADLPFNEFTRLQLAGDLLPEAGLAGQVATAFHRNTLINQEGGVKPDQFRHEAVVDRVNTTASVWLGLTVGCAQCHTHKFDPVSLTDYYRLYAFFNSCVDSNNEGPTVAVLETEFFGLSDESRSLLAELQRDRAAADRLAAQIKDETNKRQAQPPPYEWVDIAISGLMTRSGKPLQSLPDGSLLATRDAHPNEEYRIELRNLPPQIAAVRLLTLTDDSLPAQGPGWAGNGNFVLSEAELRLGETPHRFARAWADHSQTNYAVAAAIDGKADTGWAVNVKPEQVAANPKARLNAPHEAVLTLPQPLTPGETPLALVLRHDLNERYLIGRFKVQVAVQPVAEPPPLPTAELDQLRQRIAQAEPRLPGRGQPARQMVLRDLPQPVPTHPLPRGDFLNPDKSAGPLEPGVPGCLEGPPSRPLRTRLDLAEWLTDPRHPLTARVMVNRAWMRLFGTGLVETENDFGFQGTAPSHPELLDWLAITLVEQQWSLKQLLREIVCSATYRQSSDWRADLAEADPGNRWLGRQSRLRVEAEVVRDLALSASGALVHRLGGPSVHPPQPDGVYAFTQAVKSWPEEAGANRFRRTLYTQLYRSAPHPLFQTFDAPDFSNVCTRRTRSNTPLQALVLANDKVFFELARHLAGRLLSEVAPGATLEQRIEHLHHLALTRPASDAEREQLVAFWQRSVERARRAEVQERLSELTPLGAPPGGDAAEGAAWTSLARVLLNTDEFVTRE